MVLQPVASGPHAQARDRTAIEVSAVLMSSPAPSRNVASLSSEKNASFVEPTMIRP